MYSPQIKTGAVTATGAAINVPCGFVPSYVKVVNIAAAATVSLEWWNTMADAKGLKETGVVDSGTTGFKSSEYLASLGITPYAGSATVSAGFTIGADTTLNVNTNGLVWIAIGGA